MSSEEKLTISCEVDGQKTVGFVLRRPLRSEERVMRASKMFAIFFGIALLTVFIPVLHFILPPLFLLAGIVFATTTWMETAEVLSGEIACPNCKQVMVFQKEAEDWPKTQRCAGCSYLLTVKPEGT